MHSAYYRVCMWFSRPHRFSKKTVITYACPPTAKLSRFATVAVSTLTTCFGPHSLLSIASVGMKITPARPAIAVSRRGYACGTLLPCRQMTCEPHIGISTARLFSSVGNNDLSSRTGNTVKSSEDNAVNK